MSEADIQNVLARTFYSKGMIFNNCHFGGFEADFLLIRKSNITHEVEIKCSKSDFRRDFTHKTTWLNQDDADKYGFKVEASRFPRSGVKVGKHALLAAGYEYGPQRFSFCCPDGLLKPEDVPEKYGLLYAMKTKAGKTYIKEIRTAKFLHKVKATDQAKMWLLVPFHNNRTYKETYTDFLSNEKDEKQKSIERKARRWDKAQDAIWNSGLEMETCSGEGCTKPMIKGEGLKEYCWKCELRQKKDKPE